MAVIANDATNKSEKESFSPLSKFMALVEFDPANRTMDITFHSGAKVRYLSVSATTFLSFKQSPTHDSYYSRAVKGNLTSVQLIDKSIGRKKSTPFNRQKKEQPLDRGLRKQLAHQQRIAGTIRRAFGSA